MDTYIEFNAEAILNKISDITRIVDPVKKKIIERKKDEAIVNAFHCFDFWGKNRVCNNCISMRAYNENNTYVKFEYINNNTYMMNAVPYNLEDRRVVIEIIKDITNSMYFGASESAGMDPAGIHALIDNMNKLAFNDSLTGLYNRRYISEKLPVDLLNTALLKQDMSIIMADIDFFKSVNDKYGHVAGDYTLKKVSETLRNCVKRDTDWIGRYGGEEFLICMPGADIEVAKTMAEYMRSSIEGLELLCEDMEFRVTVSFGVFSMKPTGTESIDYLIKQTDEKLYLAKNNGRNRVEY